MHLTSRTVLAFTCLLAMSAPSLPAFALAAPAQATELFPLSAVRLLPGGPFSPAVAANRAYLVAHDPDRLLAAFRREAGLEPRKPSYGDWENIGLDGHTAGHYLAALADMIAATGDAELRRRLDYMVNELALCQQAAGDGYVGGIPGGRAFWADFAAGKIKAGGFALNGKWVPWYNLHKTFAGLRDAYLVAGNTQAREILVRYGDWCERVTSGLSDAQMQDMLRAEQGGMCEVLADISVITGDEKYLRLAKRFEHRAVLDPLIRHEDKLTGLHANTQIPKIIGLQRVAALTGDAAASSGARFFWETVTQHRSVAFGGNSMSEHFNDPHDFRALLEHRQGPETCNTYNMLRLTEQLFTAAPDAAQADYYERALYNHLLASINPEHPGYVYFTPIRPDHYRVYSQPEVHFWCCVGTGMENPGKYGEFIYARAADGLYVNLFIGSELAAPALGLVLRQETAFPDEARTRLALKLDKPATFTLRVRHPGWVAAGAFAVRVNGRSVATTSQPSSYAALTREWRDGDTVEIELPMRTTTESLPDGSPWRAIFHGPILLAAPAGTDHLDGLRAGEGRSAHIANGPLAPLDQAPVLLAAAEAIPAHVAPDAAAGPLHFRLTDIVTPAPATGLPLVPFFRLHDARYQIYFNTTTAAAYAESRERAAAAERAKLDREAATLDRVTAGEQQPEVDHAFAGEDTTTGEHKGRHWRHGRWFAYTLATRGEKTAELVVTYWGGDRNRHFDITAGDSLLAVEHLDGSGPKEFIERRYPLSPEVLASEHDGTLRIKFSAHAGSLAGGVYEVRLMRVTKR